MRLRLDRDGDILALVRRARAESLVVVIAPDLEPARLAMARAAIEPLAIERAPGTRVNAVLVAATADPRDIDAAIAFLEQAPSITGQLIEVR